MPAITLTTLLLIILFFTSEVTSSAATNCSRFTTGLPLDYINNTSNNTVYVVVLLPYPDPLGRASFVATYDDGHDITPATFLAVEEINNRSDILENYTLKLILSDGGCSIRERTVISYAKDLHRDYGKVPVIGLAGPTCDNGVDTLLQLTTVNRTSFISVHWGGADATTDYSNGFGIMGPDSAFADANFELIKLNRWKSIAILYSTIEAEGLAVLQGLQRATKSSSEYKNAIQFSSEIYGNFIPLEVVRSLFIRVVIVAATPELSRRLLCLAFHNGMLFPRYQWVFETKIREDFHEITFHYNSELYSCSDEDIFAALNGGLNFFQSFFSNDDTNRIISGRTHAEYQQEYRNHIETYKERFCVEVYETRWSAVTYDSVWALAVAFNNVVSEFESLTARDSLQGRELQEEIANIVREGMLSVDFQGATGRIKFNNKTHFIEPRYDLLQYNSSGHYDSETVLVYNEGRLITLPETSGHFIESSFESRHNRLPTSVAIPLLVSTSVALIITIAVQLISTLYRNKKSIKASSHRLNHIILVGFYLVLVGIAVYTLQQTIVSPNTKIQTAFCHMVPWCVSTGLTLVLGMVCLKTWRLYYIFTSSYTPTHTRTKKLLLKDSTLGVFQCAITLIDVIVLLVWSVRDPLLPREMMSQNPDGTVSIESECSSMWTLPFTLILGGGKLLMLFCSLVFALLTRNRQMKEFETKNIVMLVYLLSILSAVGVPTYLIVSIQELGLIVEVLVLNALLLTVMGVCFAVLFLPPIVPLLKEKFRVAPLSKNSTK